MCTHRVAVKAALSLCGEIDNVPNASINLNKDFTAEMLTPQEITAILGLYSAGTITLDQLLARLYESEVVSPIDTPSQ